MKYILLLFPLSLSIGASAQFVVGGQTMTIQGDALFTVDRLVLQPSTDLSLQNNQLQRTTVAVPIGSGNSIGRVYSFTHPVSFSGTIGFGYEDGELAGNTEATLNLLYNPATTGNVWATGTGSAVNTATNYISAMTGTTVISRITASEAMPLPVTLLEFTARKDNVGKTAILDWAVTLERNVETYSLERSVDGKAFRAIGSVPAVGLNNYSFIDEHPAQGNNYYRLKVIDIDGNYVFSNVRMLQFVQKSFAFWIYPNPVGTGNLTIATDRVDKETMQAVVVDINGRTVCTFALNDSRTTIDVSQWQSGMYIIKLSNGSALKFVKQ